MGIARDRPNVLTTPVNLGTILEKRGREHIQRVYGQNATGQNATRQNATNQMAPGKMPLRNLDSLTKCHKEINNPG